MNRLKAVTKQSIGFLSCLVLIALSLRVLAEEPADTLPDSTRIESITVTATKQRSDLQRTSIAISAFDMQSEIEGRFESMSDVANQVPGLTIGNTGNSAFPEIFLRGVGSTDPSVGSDPSIGFYVDDVYVGRGIGMLTDLFDLERIEVIKGPQGSLWGRNTIGGAIHLITKAPGADEKNQFNLSFGNYADKSIGGLFSAEISDSLTAKASFSARKRDGYSVNTFDNTRLGDADNFTVRGSLLNQISDRSELLIRADYTQDRSTSAAFDPLLTGQSVLGGLLDDFLGVIRVDDIPFSHVEPEGEYVVNNRADGREHRDIYGISSKYTYSVKDYTFESITALRGMELDEVENTDGLSIQLVELSELTDQKQFSQEFRFSGITADYEWMFGTYYFYEQTDDQLHTDSQDFNLLLEPFIGPKDYSSINTSDVNASNYAVYGNIKYNLTERVRMDVGLRYSRETKDYQFSRVSNEEPNFIFDMTLLDPSVIQDPTEESWSAFSPSLTLTYAADDQSIFYGSISKGFRSGGFNSFQSIVGDTYDPEHLVAYQAGYKSVLADARLQIDASVFYYDHQDMQVQTLISQGGGTVRLVTSNAAEATEFGLDLGVKAVLSEKWRLDASLTILDASYDEFINASDADVSGNMVKLASKYGSVVGLEYASDLTSGIGGRFRVEYGAHSKRFFTETNVSSLMQPSYSMVNSYLEFSFDQSSMLATIYGKNLTDEVVTSAAVDFLDILGTVSRVYQAPRTYGIQLKFLF